MSKPNCIRLSIITCKNHLYPITPFSLAMHIKQLQDRPHFDRKAYRIKIDKTLPEDLQIALWMWADVEQSETYVRIRASTMATFLAVETGVS